jgi:hypothetical protein
LIQVAPDFFVRELCSRIARHYHTITHGNAFPVQPEELSDNPFDAISFHRTPRAASNDYSQPTMIAMQYRNKDWSDPRPYSMFLDPCEVTALHYTESFDRPLRRRLLMVLRPAAVFIFARKPAFRLRFKLLG